MNIGRKYSTKKLQSRQFKIVVCALYRSINQSKARIILKNEYCQHKNSFCHSLVIQYQREVREVSKSCYWDNLDSLCILNGDEGQNSTKMNFYFELRIDVFNLAGVFLHILADALGSVVVIISALVIWLTDWQYKYVKSKNNKHSVNFLNGRIQKFIDYFPGRAQPPIKD